MEEYPPDPKRVEAILEALDKLYPRARTELSFSDPWQLLVAAILSAQCTDQQVNKVTPVLFSRYPTPQALAQADLADVEAIVKPTGFFRNKARAIVEVSKAIVERHGGKVPSDLEALVALPGVGRKTANVVRSNAFGLPAITVDTHVKRLSARLGLTRHTDPVKIEFDLMEIIPPERWSSFSHQLILHGRRVCTARKPRCGECLLRPHCPYGRSRQ